MNLEHHTEQMEAARAGFLKLWHGKLLPRAIALNNRVTLAELGLVQDIAWQAFVHALNIRGEI